MTGLILAPEVATAPRLQGMAASSNLSRCSTPLHRTVVLALALLAPATGFAQAPGAKPAATPAALIGPIPRESLKAAPNNAWFDRGYSQYEPNAEAMAALRPRLENVSLEVYFGTWCGDSRRQVPRLLRLLDTADFEENRVRLVGLSDRTGEFKQAPGRPEKARYVHRTPTIVVLRNGTEVGRIVETPATTLEADLAAIVGGNPPEPKYAAEAYVNRIFTDATAERSIKAIADAEPTIRGLSQPETLSHYAEFDLLRNGRALEARALLEVHLRIDPKSAIGHVLMAEAFAALGRANEAKTWAEKALVLEPGSRRAARLAGRP